MMHVSDSLLHRGPALGGIDELRQPSLATWREAPAHRLHSLDRLPAGHGARGGGLGHLWLVRICRKRTAVLETSRRTAGPGRRLSARPRMVYVVDNGNRRH